MSDIKKWASARIGGKSTDNRVTPNRGAQKKEAGAWADAKKNIDAKNAKKKGGGGGGDRNRDDDGKFA